MRIFVSPLFLAASACAPMAANAPGTASALGAPASALAIERAERDFAAMAQADGQWTAFRATAAPQANMFVPQRANAQAWLAGRADPPQSVRWWPSRVVVSCDGSAGMSTGGWIWADGSTGYFTTIWFRQPGGGYKWVLDHGDATVDPAGPATPVRHERASCEGAPPALLNVAEEGADMKVGFSSDQSLNWTSTVRTDGSREVTVWAWNGAGFDTVRADRVAAPMEAGS